MLIPINVGMTSSCYRERITHIAQLDPRIRTEVNFVLSRTKLLLVVRHGKVADMQIGEGKGLQSYKMFWKFPTISGNLERKLSVKAGIFF